jgi:hypothetical protein
MRFTRPNDSHRHKWRKRATNYAARGEDLLGE